MNKTGNRRGAQRRKVAIASIGDRDAHEVITDPEVPEPQALFTPIVQEGGHRISVYLDRKALCAELELLAEIVETKNLLPIYSHLLIEASGNRVILKAAGFTNMLRCEIEADVREEGAICLPARKLHEIARHLPGETLILRGETNAATLRCGDSRFRLNAISPEDFPAAPACNKFRAVVPGDLLLALVRSTLFAARRENESGYYALDSAQLTIGTNGARMIATDGHRLSCAQRTDVKMNEEFILLVPRAALSALTKVLGSSEGEVSIGADENHAFFNIGSRRFSCSLLNGRFPDCEPLVSQDYRHELTLDTTIFKDAVNRMAVFGADNSRRNFGLIKFHLAPDTCEMQSMDSQGSEGQEEITLLSSGADEEITLSFNGRYLQDFARTVSGPLLTIRYNDEISSIEFCPTDDNNDGSFFKKYILMPCRV